MKNEQEALELGKYLKKIGEKFNLNVNYVITDMNQPLGQYSGLKCEVFESMEILASVRHNIFLFFKTDRLL